MAKSRIYRRDFVKLAGASALGASAWSLSGCNSSEKQPQLSGVAIEPGKFPQDFFWGAATSCAGI
jgi:hypothetical protein